MKVTQERITKEIQDFAVPSYTTRVGNTIPLDWWLKQPSKTATYLRLMETLLGREMYSESK